MLAYVTYVVVLHNEVRMSIERRENLVILLWYAKSTDMSISYA